MENIIYICEEKNRLDFCETYSPIVCGNTNYYLVFNFSSEWEQITHKTAVLVVGERVKQLQFDGRICQLPAMPNAPFAMIYLHAKKDEMMFSTTGLKIRLEPTKVAEYIKF